MIKKTAYSILLGAFVLAFTFVACNNNKSEQSKESTVDTTMMQPKMDTSMKMDTGMQKMDTGATKPVQPGN